MSQLRFLPHFSGLLLFLDLRSGGFWGSHPSGAAQHCWVYWAAYLKDVMMLGCHL
jgi:hypothetical protein